MSFIFTLSSSWFLGGDHFSSKKTKTSRHQGIDHFKCLGSVNPERKPFISARGTNLRLLIIADGSSNNNTELKS